jgi:UDP-N-acetylglucosamine 2-epimerase (non-hydrolysing)
MEGYKMKLGGLRVYDEKLKEIMDNAKNRWVLMVVTATKPDFYKQWPILPAAEKLDMPCCVLHTGQHYDNIVGYGLKELGLEDSFIANLGIKGGLAQKSAEMIAGVSYVGNLMKKKWPKTTVIPIVHGDTLAAGIGPIGWMFSRNEKVAQNEAGLRSMSPTAMRNITEKASDIDGFIAEQFNGKWEIVRNEPFPEQWDTFISGASSEFQFAPTELNREHLLREGNPDDRIFVVGNSIVDAIKLKSMEKDDKSIFEIYPTLEKYDNWVRVDIHRRGNLTEKRFRAIIGGILKLVEDGVPVAMTELNATKWALEHYGLRKKVVDYSKRYKNFLFTGLWPVWGHVVEFLTSGRCGIYLTDSGSVQEEANEIDEVMCLTVRFNTDRPETVFRAKSNLLVPPISSDWFHRMTKHVHDDVNLQKKMRTAPKIYGKNVGERIVKTFIKLQNEGVSSYRWAHEALNLWKEDSGARFL